MDLDALRTGINWDFESFSDYMAMLRRRGAYANLAVLAGHSTIRTAVMGEAASQRKDATPEELAKMKAMVADAMANGAIGLGASYSLNHSGYGGVPMPSTIAPMSELDALVGAMGPRGRGVVEIASGVEDAGRSWSRWRPSTAGRFSRAPAWRCTTSRSPRARSRSSTTAPPRIRRGNGLYVQIPCQPLSFDFTMANAYPFYSHSAFDPIKAYTPEQLKAVFRDPSWRAKFRENAKNPRPGMIFQGNWDRVMVAVAQKPSNAKYVNRYAAEIAKTEHRDPARRRARPQPRRGSRDRLPRPLPQCRRRRRRAPARSTRRAWWRSSTPARTSSICAMRALACISWRAGCASAATSTSAEGVRRLTSHPADLYGIQNRGRIARRRPGRPAAVRSGDGRRQPGRARRRSAGRRPAHHPPADRRAWRVLQRRQDVRRQGLREARQRARATVLDRFNALAGPPQHGDGRAIATRDLPDLLALLSARSC